MSEQNPAETREFWVGIDVEFVPKMLVSADTLARLFEVDASTIRRWSRQRVMPLPRNVGSRRLWSADEIRAWIRGGCPDLSEAAP